MTLEPAEVTRLRSMHDRLDMSEVEDIYLPLSRLLVALRGGDAKSVSRPARFSRHRRRQDALHHRRRRLGGGRQVDHGARAAGAACALAERAEGRSHHHRRLSLSECGARPRRPDGEERLSGKLRPAGVAALSVRHQGRPAPGARAGLFAPDLRRDPEPVDRDRPAGHFDRRRSQCAAGRALAQGRQGGAVRVRLFRFLDLSRRRGGACCCRGMSAGS